MIEVRTATDDDRPQIVEVVRAAFGREDEVALVGRVWSADEYLPDLELVAAEDGALVGHVLHSIGYVVDRPVAALAPLAVVPARQRQGIGTALMHEAILRANAANYAAIVLLGHPEYYRRFGFVPARDFGIEPSMTLPRDPDPFMVLPLDNFDRAIEGAFRYCWE